MRKLCPSACGRLVTAAIYIAIGVVQFISGIILFNSQFVYLLAVPDFWTAIANISVGCLVGVAASVWKHSNRWRPAKYIARYHLMLALLLSTVIVNSTTTLILILGEGNALLSIALEENGTLLSEILGYAYAASVLSPIVCATTAALSILSGCCPKKTSAPIVKVSKRKSHKVLSENDSTLYSWVFTRGSRDPLKEFELSRFSSSSYTPKSGKDKESFGTLVTSPTNSVFSRGPPNPRMNHQSCDMNFNFNTLSPSSAHNASGISLASFDSPMEGSVIPVRISTTLPRNYRLGIPVRAPVVPRDRRWSKSWKVKSPLSEPRDYSKFCNKPSFGFKSRRMLFSSFRDGSRVPAVKERFPDDSHNIEGLMLHRSTSGGVRLKLTPMESIREVPGEECYPFEEPFLSPCRTSGYGSSPDTILNASKLSRGTLWQEHDEDTTPKKLWNVRDEVDKINKRRPLPTRGSISSQIFDKDSLVGLSNLELIARHRRNSNLWKILQNKVSNSEKFTFPKISRYAESRI